MATLRQIPDDIRALLDGDANWDLNVIQVEKLTAKRYGSEKLISGLQNILPFGSV